MKKPHVKEESQKAFKNRKHFEVVFQITIDNFKQIICKNEEVVQHFMIELIEHKRIKVRTLQSQVQDSVENEETHDESQGQANHE